MKNFNLIQLKNAKPYKKNNLQENMHGIIIENGINFSKVLFFNSNNLGESALVLIDNLDFIIMKEELTSDLKNELENNLGKILSKSKDILEPIKIKDYDMVELVVEDEKYSCCNVHKGDRGCVMDCNAIQNYIEVDFSYINEKGEFCGDCIAVKIEDIKVLD